MAEPCDVCEPSILLLVGNPLWVYTRLFHQVTSRGEFMSPIMLQP